MVRITPNLHIVDGVTFEEPAGTMNMLNVCLAENTDGLMLIDTGNVGSLPTIEAYVSTIGHSLNDIKRIFLTHLDLDHIGSAPEIRASSGATVFMHGLDAELATNKSLDERELQELYPNYAPAEIKTLLWKINLIKDIDLKVDEVIEGREPEVAEGVTAFHTPGHTPGHCCLLLQRESTLITADTITTSSGKVMDPRPQYTVRLQEARKSLEGLRTLRFERLVPFHDPPILHSASDALMVYLDGIGK